jgi:hypothetical protein
VGLAAQTILVAVSLSNDKNQRYLKYFGSSLEIILLLAKNRLVIPVSYGRDTVVKLTFSKDISD